MSTKYDVVIIPESFHRFDKHGVEHTYPSMVIGDRSYDIAMEIVNGDRKYTLEKEDRKGIVHVKLRRVAENCPPVDGNRCSVLEFERDIKCIVKGIEECLA